ncbi:MAG: phage tail protein [Pseudomonadota bacterium]|nr:phage tail protein [Pseudomonadota bacterium]
MSSGKKKKQTVGYRYGLTIHMGFCHGPVDAVSQIDVDDRAVWKGIDTTPPPPDSGVSGWKKLLQEAARRLRSNIVDGDTITSSTTIPIRAWHIFGGDEKEGGVSGTAEICMGEQTQGRSPLLTAALGSSIPAFRGIFAIVFRGLISANNPYLKGWQVLVSRVLSGWNTPVWYSEKAAIGVDMNPAHIVYQCITDTEWGMGYPTAIIDTVSFAAAADTLYDEGFGLSLMWNQQSTIQAFIQIVFDHIGGALRIDPKTGKYQIKLIRADYDIEELPVFDPSNVSELQSFQRAGWGETINELTVAYTDPDTRKETAVTVHDLANVQAQAQVVSQKINYSGINSHDIAQRVAIRDLLARSSPLAKAKFTVNRQAWNLLQGDVFVLDWPKLGLSGVVLRVITVSTGTLENGMITVEATEDAFGLPISSYGTQQDQGWINPLAPPAPSPARLLTEATYYDLATSMTAADLSFVEPDDGYAVIYAQQHATATVDYTLKTRVGSADFVAVDTAAHCAVATILSDLVIEEFSAVNISIVGSLDGIDEGDYAIIGSEYVRLDDIDLDTGLLTIARGVLDTVPQAHATGSKLFFAEGFEALDPKAYPDGALIDAKVITATTTDVLADDDAPIDSIEIVARHNKPYPPALFRLNSDYLPAEVDRAVTVSWAHRNRLQQTVYLLAQDESSVTPEPDVTYTIRIYDQDSVLCRSVTGLTGTSYTYPIEDELTDCGGMQTHLTVELLAVRDGIESYQSHSHRFERNYGGFGFEFGSNWGGA